MGKGWPNVVCNIVVYRYIGSTQKGYSLPSNDYVGNIYLHNLSMYPIQHYDNDWIGLNECFSGYREMYKGSDGRWINIGICVVEYLLNT